MYVLAAGYLALHPDRRTKETEPKLVTAMLFNALLVVFLLPQVSTAKSDAVHLFRDFWTLQYAERFY
jgi:hypothetical protein